MRVVIPSIRLELNRQLIRENLNQSALSRHQVQLLEFIKKPRSFREMMNLLGWTDRTKFRKKYIKPLLNLNLVKMTVPDKPTSRNQKYYAV